MFDVTVIMVNLVENYIINFRVIYSNKNLDEDTTIIMIIMMIINLKFLSLLLNWYSYYITN